MTPAPAAARAKGAALVEGEFALTSDDFARIARRAHADAGLFLPASKANLVYSRLAKRLRARGLRSFADYCALIESPAGETEREAMLAALTTNVTRFFREPHHFEHLREHVAPGLAARARAGERVRLWSAACSTGEEPYSLALTLLEAFPDAPRWDVRILATDIDPQVRARAREAAYSDEAVAPIPVGLRQRWLGRAPGGGWRVGEEARALVRVRALNLIGEWPMRARFDAIFCRNVAIYFDAPTQRRLWSRLAGALTPEGRLYIGHSERIDQAELESDGLTIYRRAIPAGERA